MPIDFDAIARDFRRRIARDLALVLESFKRLSLVVRKTVDANEKLERAARQFPVLDFQTEDALTVSIGSFHDGGAATVRGTADARSGGSFPRRPGAHS